MPSGKKQFRGDDVLSALTYMLPGPDRRVKSCKIFVCIQYNVLYLNDCIAFRRERLTGIDQHGVTPRQIEMQWSIFPRIRSFFCMYGQAIHGRCVERR